MEHSNECNKLYKQNFSISSDINKDINTYEEFKNSLIEYLNVNPLINYTSFRKFATDLYYKTQSSFEI